MMKLALPSAVIDASPPTARSDWANDLVMCCNGPKFGPNCCIQSCFCEPCLITSSMGWSDCSNPLLAFVSLTCCANSPLLPIASFMVRRHVVEKYAIEEDVVTSGAIAVLCIPCSLVQVHGKVALEENLSYGCARLVPAQAGVAPNSMVR